MHYWKHSSGSYYAQPVGQTLEDMGLNAEDLQEISEAEYKSRLAAEAARITEKPAPVETATAEPTRTRRTRRVRGE